MEKMPTTTSSDYARQAEMATKSDQTIRDSINQLIDEAEPIEPDAPEENYLQRRPFPMDALPSVLAEFIAEKSASMGCDPAMVALPVLATTAAAIGLRRSIELKEGWIEPSIIWAFVVAPSGTLKTPAFKAAIKPLLDLQSEACAEYQTESCDYKRRLNLTKNRSTGDTPGRDEPSPPVMKKFIVMDCTVEALALIHRDNPLGFLLARDEASGWFRSFGQYKNGKGSDEQFWLELSQGGPISVDRKTGDCRNIYVPKTGVSICGTIQPGILEAIMTPQRHESGMVARILLAAPEQPEKRWTKRFPSAKAVQNYEDLIRTLTSMDSQKGNMNITSKVLPLAEEAKPVWEDWYNELSARSQETADDREKAFLAKMEAYTARFGLLLQLAENVYAEVVTKAAMRNAIELSEWFISEHFRLYSQFLESDEERQRRELLEYIARNGGRITQRELQRKRRTFGKAEDAKAALNDLVQAGRGRWKDPKPGGQGGRPSSVFILSTVDKTP